MNESADTTPGKSRRWNPNSRQVEQLFNKVDAFIWSPRAADAFLGEWLHDDSLPVPSAEVLEFFAWDMLLGVGKYQRFIDAEIDWQKTVREYLRDLRFMSEDSLWNFISHAIARKKIAEFCGASCFDLHWWPALTTLGMEDEGLDSIPQLSAGKRRLARFVLEQMTLRATLLKEVLYLNGLAAFVSGKESKPQMCQQIAFRIIDWNPYLSHELERSPSKTELQYFLQQIYPKISDSPATWADAHKLVKVRTAEPKSCKIDKSHIEKLAERAVKAAPGVKADRRLRRTRYPGTGEVLQ
jgi:hypothetical protein